MGEIKRKILRDGAELIMESYPFHHETSSLSDRILGRKAYSLTLSYTLGRVGFSSNMPPQVNLHFDRRDYDLMYEKIRDKHDFDRIERFLKSLNRDNGDVREQLENLLALL